MMEKLLTWDADLLLKINGWHTPFWNTFMWWTSKSYVWIPLYLLLIFLLILAARKQYKGAKTAIILSVLLGVLCIAASAGLADFITSGILKKTICRPRPTHSSIASLIHLVNGYTGGKYGFPSSHAANCWAVATSFIVIHRRLNPAHMIQFSILQFPYWIVILYALLNCYSRMYLGVHYPLDIICGSLIGILLGLFFGWIFKKIVEKLH